MRRPSVRPVSTSAASLPSLARGVVVGHYRLEKEIARGGMGEVYRATDVRLKRTVALKVLRGEAAQETRRVERFAREAEAASALNHPGIVAVYEAGRSTVHGEPIFYLAMEAVDGPSLATVLAAERLPLKRALELAAGIAEALAAAHEAGILHRDLKPSNIIVSAGGDGVPRIVDFGLAKQATDADGAARDRERETLTEAGEILGTAGYMSPEQARGDPVTGASDQFSFGCVLYELLTGARAFDAGSFVETLSAVLRDEPAPIESIAPEVPLPIRWIVSRCLSKSPGQRYHSTLDLARDLRTLLHCYRDLVDGPHVPRPSRPSRRGALMVGSLTVVVLGASLAGPRSAVDAPTLEFTPLSFRPGFVARALFTPRSNAILVAAAWEGQPLRMYQTMAESVGFDRSLDAPAQLPLAYSEDGAQVLVLLGVTRESNLLRGTLAWWPALGGTPRPLMEDAGWSDWAPRSHQLAVVRDVGSSRILELHDEDGRVRRILHSAPGAISWVRFSPDEDRIAFIRLATPYGTRGAVWIVDVHTGEARALTPLMSQCRGLDWNRLTGEIWFTASHDNPWTSTLCRMRADGSVDYVQALPGAYHLQGIDAAHSRWLITSYDDDSDIVLSVPPRPAERQRWFGWSLVSDISPDSKSYLFYDGGAGKNTWGLWIRPLANGDAFRIGAGVTGRFSPDGRWVVATGGGTDEPAQIVVLPVGAGEARTLTAGTASYSWPSFEDTETILAVRQDGNAADVVRIRRDGGRIDPLEVKDCDMPSASPQDRLLLCVGDAGRQLRAEPLRATGGRRSLVHLEGGRIKTVRWNQNGRQAYAFTSDRRLITSTLDGNDVKIEDLNYIGAGPYDRLITGAIDTTGRSRAYSIARTTSALFLGTPKRE